MRFERAAIAAALFSAFCAPTLPVNASPFTYHFDLPNWNVNTNPLVFGTSGLLDLIVDNGNATANNQGYMFADITSMSLSAVGGTFSVSGATATSIAPTGTIFLSTDASGVPTLNLLSHAIGDVFDSTSIPGIYLQLGITTPSSGPFPVYAQDPGFDMAWVQGPTNCNTYCGISVVGNLVSVTAVPEPITVSLFGVGVAGAFAARRRKVKV